MNLINVLFLVFLAFFVWEARADEPETFKSCIALAQEDSDPAGEDYSRMLCHNKYASTVNYAQCMANASQINRREHSRLYQNRCLKIEVRRAQNQASDNDRDVDHNRRDSGDPSEIVFHGSSSTQILQ